jgi:hypothetical protein
MTALLERPATAPSSPLPTGATRPAVAGPAANAPRIDVGEIAVRNGVLSWRDEMITPARRSTSRRSRRRSRAADGRFDRSTSSWRSGPRGGGELRASGRVAVEPLGADLRVQARDAELAHYQPYCRLGRNSVAGRMSI